MVEGLDRAIRHAAASLLASSPFGILVLDEEGRIVDRSGPLAAPFESGGLAEDELPILVGMEEDLARIRDGATAPLHLPNVNFTDPDGEIRFVSLYVLPGPDDSQLSVLLKDTSETSMLRREVQQQRNDLDRSNEALRKSERELRIARDRAEEATRAKSMFLAVMTHEIRTPLNGVLGMLQLLLDSELRGEQSDFARTAHSSAQALIAIINDVLDYSKIEAGKLDLEAEPFDVVEVVEDVAELLASRAQERGIELMSFVAPEVDAARVGDAGRVRQILLNLVGNAVKFTERGGVTIEVRAEVTGAHAASVRFEVTDTGIGIAEEARDRLFSEYSQESASTARQYGGTGLGLSISKRLVERMGGAIGVESTPGRGSCFWFRIPLERGGVATPPAPMRDGIRGLVVSDNVVFREGLRRHLEASGCGTDLAGDVQGAVEVMERESRAGRPIHVVLFDNEAIREDPREVADRFSGREGSREARLVLVHQMGRSADATQALERGYAAVLRKPPRRASLSSTLDRALRETPTPREPVPEEAPRKRPPRPVRTERILLVDDTEANRDIASRMLGRAGFQVDAVASGEAALESVRSGSYDLVLMDIQMPGMNGFEATSAIRSLEGPPSRVPVVAMTANAVEELDRDLERAGFDAFIGKPILKKAMLETVDQLLAREGEAASAEPTPAPPGEGVLDSETLNAFRESVGTDAFPELLDTFLQEIRRQVAAIGADAGEGRLEEVERNAHNVKGCAGTVGATALQKTSEALERASRDRDTEVAQRLIQEFGAAADAALQALADFRRQLRSGS